MMESAVNKLLHAPTTKLKSRAAEAMTRASWRPR